METTSLVPLLDGAVRRAQPERAARPRPGAVSRPPPVARAAVRAAALLAPALTARALARRFLTPRRVRLEEDERDMIAAAERIEVPFDGGRLAVYAWGRDGPTVLLVHGWSSAAGQLTALVEPLRRLGFRVVAFDAPAHGASDGETTSALEIAEVVLAVGRVVGPLHAVIGHSAGAAAAARAVTRGLRAGRLALLSPWTRPQTWVVRFAAAFGLSRAATARLVRAVEAEAGDRLHAIDLEVIAPAVARPTLVVHDRDDALVEIADVRVAAAALPAGTLVETGGLGHSRILRSRDVVARVVGFVAGERRATAAGSGNPR